MYIVTRHCDNLFHLCGNLFPSLVFCGIFAPQLRRYLRSSPTSGLYVYFPSVQSRQHNSRSTLPNRCTTTITQQPSPHNATTQRHRRTDHQNAYKQLQFGRPSPQGWFSVASERHAHRSRRPAPASRPTRKYQHMHHPSHLALTIPSPSPPAIISTSRNGGFL